MSRNIANRNNGSSDEYGHLLLLTRLFGGGGVAEGLAVVAATSPNMTVIVSQGSAMIPTGTYPSSYGYHAWIDTTAGSPAGEVVTIATASSSNPRIDTIVIYVDLSVTASSGTANNTNNMLKVAAVAGTPAGSPVAPSNATIQSAIGASNPFIKLANVTVGTSVTSISNTNIADARSFATVANQNLSITLGYAASSTPQSGLTTTTDLTGFSLTVVVPPGGKRIEMDVTFQASNSSANTQNTLQINEGSTLIKAYPFATLNTSNAFGFSFFTVITPTPGSHTYKLTYGPTGGGTVNIFADAPTKIINEFLIKSI